MMRVLPAPMERLASTNSFSLSESVFPRTTRATYGHEKRTITAMTIDRPGLINPPAQPSFVVLHAATMPIEIRTCGTASMTSAPRESVVSAQPPKKPAMTPTNVPISTARPDATMPTSSDVRAPYITRTKRSLPAASAPKWNCEFGPLGMPNSSVISYVNGSFWA